MSTTQEGPSRGRPAGLVTVDGRTFPLEGAGIDAHAEGGIARTVYTQQYANPYDTALEVLYTMPLPADGAVIGYRIRMEERLIVGEIQRREEARESYLKALEEGRTAGLLEQERADTFTQSLGSLPAGVRVEVEIEILHPLAFHPASNTAPGRWEYRFPTVAGVRYEGAPGRVPDADRLDVPRAGEGGTPARLTLDLLVAGLMPDAGGLTSPSHPVRCEIDAEGRGTRCTFVEPVPLDRDVRLLWQATTDTFALRLISGGGLAGDQGRYGLLTITPPSLPKATFGRDLTLLLDASGSMSGIPIEIEKTVAASLLESLTMEDRFEILVFSDRAHALVGGPVPATPDEIARALAKLRALEASGGTEMAHAVEQALRPLRGDSQRQIVLVTDGFIGFESEVVARIVEGLPRGARLHTVGIGAAPNRTLTRGGARAGRGIEVLISTIEEAEEGARRLLAATVAPLLVDLSVGGGAVKAVAPERPRDVLSGGPLAVAVELHDTGGTIEVRGDRPGAGAWVHTLRVPARASGGEHEGAERPGAQPLDVGAADMEFRTTTLPLGALFGREAIEDVEMHLAAAGGDGESRASSALLSRIEELGLRHRIPSRRTSLVAISEVPTVDPKEPRRRERLAVEMPFGVSAEGVGLTMPSGAQGFAMMARRIGAPMFSIRAPKAAIPGKRLKERVLRADRKGVLYSLARHGTTIEGRFLRTDGDLIVMEIDSPWDGFELPGSDSMVSVTIDRGREIAARVDEALTTSAGPHRAGLTLRLALRTIDGSVWSRGRALVLWTGKWMGVTIALTIGEPRGGA